MPQEDLGWVMEIVQRHAWAVSGPIHGLENTVIGGQPALFGLVFGAVFNDRRIVTVFDLVRNVGLRRIGLCR